MKPKPRALAPTAYVRTVIHFEISLRWPEENWESTALSCRKPGCGGPDRFLQGLLPWVIRRATMQGLLSQVSAAVSDVSM